MKNILLILASIISLAGCTSVELAPSTLDTEAKRFTQAPDKSVVYVVQTGGLGSYRVFLQVTLNGQFVASLSGNTYSRLILNPGKYRILVSSPENQESISFESKAGEVIYLGAKSKPGFAQMRVVPIQRLSTQEGQNAVLDSSMAALVDP